MWCLLIAEGLEAVLVTSTTSRHNTKEGIELVMVSLADSTDDCTGIYMGDDTNLGSAKEPTTPTMSTAK